MNSHHLSPQTYYASPGPVTGPGEHMSLLQNLPGEVSALCEILHGTVIHIFWAERYGLTLSEERKQEVNLRKVARQLQRLVELEERPLIQVRSPEKRLVGNCRDFSILLAAMLRQAGVPARARCGFGTYFVPGRFEDHWMCEYWRADQQRWVKVDPQLDALQCEVLGISFDPLDLPPDAFWTGGRAWQACRAGKQNPDDFGIFDMKGLGFIQGNVIRDLLALNKIEILPWDWGWGLLQGNLKAEGYTPEFLAEIDRLAELAENVNDCFPEVIAEGQSNPDLQLPKELA